MSWKVRGYFGLHTAFRRVTGAVVFSCFCAASFAQTTNDHDWPTASLNPENTRFSPLNQITADNAKDLRVAWTFGTGVNCGHEEGPIVVGSTMYLVTPYPNYLYALDLAHNGMIKWRFESKTKAAAQGEACCDNVNRGVAFADGKIIMNTLDARTIPPHRSFERRRTAASI